MTRTVLSLPTDEKWLSFVISHFINALKYAKEGSITITSMTRRLALIISDTGVIREPAYIFDKGFYHYNGRSGQKSTELRLYLLRDSPKSSPTHD